MVRVEDGEHMVQDKRACGKQYERGNQRSRTRMEMKGRVQMIHGDYERDQGNGDQSRKNTGSKKGNTQGCTEIGDETRTRRGRGEDEDEVRLRLRRG